MKKKLIAAILTGAMLVAGMSTGVWAESEKSFVYGTTGYSEEMGDAGLNPHDNYSGWSALRYGVGETLFKYNDNMPPMAEWGSMINDGRSMLQISPWMVLAPGLAIFITVMIFNLLGDTLRDFMDPKERAKR